MINRTIWSPRLIESLRKNITLLQFFSKVLLFVMFNMFATLTTFLKTKNTMAK